MKFWIWSDQFNYFFVRKTAASLIRADPPRSDSGGLESGSVATCILVYIYIYICVYICAFIYTSIPVDTLPDSSLPLALRGGSAYGPYEWCRWSSHQKKKNQNGLTRFKISKLNKLKLNFFCINFHDPGYFILFLIVKTSIDT